MGHLFCTTAPHRVFHQEESNSQESRGETLCDRGISVATAFGKIDIFLRKNILCHFRNHGCRQC
jgi:hypothetical protein